MRYIPDLIPEKSKVDIDFSKRYIPEEKKEDNVLKKLEYNFQIILCSIFFLIGIIFLFTRFYFSLPLILAGLLIIPDVRNRIERLLQFKFTTKLQLIVYATLIAVSCAFIPQYVKEEERIAAIEKEEEERLRIEEEKKVAEENTRLQLEQSFLKKYPYIKASDYRQWLIEAKDSVKNNNLKIANFTKAKKKDFLLHQQALNKVTTNGKDQIEKNEPEIDETGNSSNEEQTEAKDRVGIQGEKVVIEENLTPSEQSFLKEYPYIKLNDYRNWLLVAKDSISNRQLKKANFTKSKKREFIKYQEDSIKLVKEEKDRIKREQREQSVYKANNTYNGHVIQTGPRGGKYYINKNGNKTYIKR